MSNIVNSPLIAKGTAGATAATGLEAIFLQYVPQFLSMGATCVGIVLSVVLIHNHWKKGKLERQKLQLEIDAAKRADACEKE